MNEENQKTQTTPVEEPVTQQSVEQTAPVAEQAAPVAPAAPEIPAAQPVAQPVQQPINNGVVPPVQQAPVQQPINNGVVPPVQQTPVQQSKNNNIIFIAIVAVLVLLIIVVGAILVVINIKKDKPTNEQTTTTTVEIEYTTKYPNTTNTVVSTTTRTYTTTTYVPTTRATKSPSDPTPVSNKSTVYKVDNYNFDLGSQSDFEVYEQDGKTFLYDKVDKMQLTFKVYEGMSVVEQESEIEIIGEKLINMGFKIIDTAKGNIDGIEVIYYTLTDGKYYYTDLFMNTNYGDIIEVQTMSLTHYNGKSVCELAYKIISRGVKVGPAVTNAPASGNNKFNIFDERLFD